MLASAACIVAGSLGSLLKLACKDVIMHWSTMEHVKCLLGMGFFIPLALAVRVQYKPAVDSSEFSYTATDWAMVMASAVTSFIGFSLQTWGYQNARAGEGSLMAYIEIPISLVLQIAFFGQGIDALDVIGSAMVMLAGMLTLFAQGIANPTESDELKAVSDGDTVSKAESGGG